MRRTGCCSRVRPGPLLAAIVTVCLAGCGETPDTDNEVKPVPPGQGEADEGPVRLAYLCGNRFLITNAYSVPVSLTYRILGTEEDGSADLPAAPPEDPAFSERMIETRTQGAVQLYFNGEVIAARPNDGIPCTPTTPAPALLSASTATAGQWTAPSLAQWWRCT